jgi:SEC-C motif
MDQSRASRNDPCSCGSGKKYKHCCMKKDNESRFPRPSLTITGLHGKPKKRAEHPIGTVACCGPDDKTTTKIAAGVMKSPTAEPIIRRWVATDVTTNPKVQREMEEFFSGHGVKLVAMNEGIMGCPHEEGEDFLEGTDCPFCPFWAGKQGSNRRD